MKDRDACLEARLEQCRDKARSWSLILPSVARNAVNRLEKRRAYDLYDRAGRLFGRRTWEHAAGLAIIGLTGLWKLRLKIFGDRLQPKTIVTRSSASGAFGRLTARRVSASGSRPTHEVLPPAAAALSPLEPTVRISGLPTSVLNPDR